MAERKDRLEFKKENEMAGSHVWQLQVAFRWLQRCDRRMPACHVSEMTRMAA
jgi:hypothetical protein